MKNIDAENSRFAFSAVGHIESCARYHYEAPRQPVFAVAGAFLRWDQRRYAECAVDLEGFDRIHLIWVFDRNKHDKFRSKVRVPIPAEKDCYSVFATRSPYRPNPIGLSVVELKNITPEGLELGPCDLLDGTAVLDVKPYIPEVDAFPESRAGWRDRIEKSAWLLDFSSAAQAQMAFIRDNGALDLENFCHVQLKYRPTDKSRKRVEFDAVRNLWVLHCRTWKIFFQLNESAQNILIAAVDTNYSWPELDSAAPDPYTDKALHRDFLQKFKSTPGAEAATADKLPS